jgi:hypothetical protein
VLKREATHRKILISFGFEMRRIYSSKLAFGKIGMLQDISLRWLNGKRRVYNYLLVAAELEERWSFG